MSLFKDTFKRTTASKANDKKALEILSKKKNKILKRFLIM